MNIGQLLVGRGLLTPAQMEDAVGLLQSQGLRLDRAIIQLGFLTEAQMLELMAEYLHLPMSKLDELTIPPETLRCLPPKVVYRKRMIPIGRVNGTLRVATSDAFDLYALDDLRLSTGLEIEPVLATSEDIEKIIKS